MLFTHRKGTRIYALNEAVLENFGDLRVEGIPDSNVIFRYFRREANFSNVLGVWRGLRLRKNSQNVLRYTQIYNANVGILVDSTEALLEGLQLQSMSEAALVGLKAKIFIRNSLLNNAITRLLQATNGGEYELVHCTFANYEFFFNRQDEAGSVFINQAGADTMKIRLFNNIFWGNLNDEVIFSGEKIDLSAANNIFRTRLFEEPLNTNNNLVNIRADSLFRNPRRFDYSLPSISPAISKGISTSITTDILGKTRKNPPDIGAFER
ncbi:MAG: choice-of-anchor Q domain-containing protein [Raineya sp.]